MSIQRRQRHLKRGWTRAVLLIGGSGEGAVLCEHSADVVITYKPGIVKADGATRSVLYDGCLAMAEGSAPAVWGSADQKSAL